MFRFLKSKLRSKKWLNFSLLLGIVLLTAVVSCHPMFLYGSLNKLLDSSFQEYIIEENKYPMVISRIGAYNTADVASVETVKNKQENHKAKWLDILGIEAVETQFKLEMAASVTDGSFGAKNKYLDISYLEDMESHINVVKGVKLSEAKTEQGVYPCLMSTVLMDGYELTCGEVITFNQRKDNAGNPIRFQIVGVFEESDTSDIYWYERSGSFIKQIFVTAETMETLMSYDDFESVTFAYYAMLDYTGVTGQNVDDIQYYTGEFIKADERMSVNYMELLDIYQKNAQTVSTLLWVLELPMLVLLLAFIYMVSGQILQMETGEIAMMKSRGVSRGEIIILYLEQSGVLSVAGALLGGPLGFLLCKLAASADSFLAFHMNDTSGYRFVWQVVLYLPGAVLAAMICMTLPVLGYSKLSIVQQKSANKRQGKTSFWEKYFLDVALAAISIYLLYNYYQQKSMLALRVLEGNALDPVIFINVSLFMLACGLVVLRLIHYLVRFIYYIGKNRWSPALYASFLQITRTFEKQGFISIFLVMTLAMGIFNSNMVRTINENESERITYNIGSDVTFQEYWQMITIVRQRGDPPDWLYREPDFERYAELEKQGSCESITKVLVDDQAVVVAGNSSEPGCRLMGINTKEFGETAVLKDGLNDQHWYYALNALAETSNGVIISSNLAKKRELKVGDTVSFERISPVNKDERLQKTVCSIVAIVDAWPSYNGYTYSYSEAGELQQTDRYLLVCNYAFLINTYGQTPYEIWAKLARGHHASEVQEYIAGKEIVSERFDSVEDSMEAMQSSPIIQITNGMYTLSFLVAIVLCLVGFLIYWVTSIKQRELLFGIYRAMGMNMKDINKMLINEQIFSSLFAVLGGTGVGILSVFLFVRLVAVVYLPETHNITLEIHSNGWDMVRLFAVIVLMFTICLLVLRRLLRNMNITHALKLGED